MDEMNKFYSDAAENFRLMADNKSQDPIDAAHFKMWCRVAETEINSLRAAYRVLALKTNPNLTHDEITKFLVKITS